MNIINNKRIAKNTILLYFRMAITILIQLYSVPIILKSLGVSDYGLYNVIGSVMAMISLVGFIASGCQRFFSFAIGKNDEDQLERLFNTTQTIYFLLSGIILVVLEVIGIWFINSKMQIPEGRLVAAHWVFQLSTISFIVSLISVPYNALIIAHERMRVFAYISIITSILKLLAAISIQYVIFDKLIIYAVFILAIQLFERFFWQIYCFRHFRECRHYKLELNKKLTTDLLIYSSYNIIGAIAITLRKQGMNIIMNIFFGTILNAAHGIATQIHGVMEQLINNIYHASRPQITKSYASGDIDGMWKLVFRTSLLSYYLVMTMSVVVLFELPSILSLWLHEVPLYTINICRIFILCLMMETITNQLIGVFQAMNKIRDYQIVSSVILILNLPISYIILKADSTHAMAPYVVQLILSLIYIISIIFISKRTSGLNVEYFLFRIIFREILSTIFVFLAVFACSIIFHPSVLRIIISIICSIIVSVSYILLFGFERTDLILLRNKMKQYKFKSYL